jgi:hypothetical protein
MEYSYNIKIICSFHTEIGKCNPAELYRIIEDIRPEVIFEELPINIYQSIYSGQKLPQTVESKAVLAYSNNYIVKHFPVDTYNFDLNELFSDYEFIMRHSTEYIELFNKLIATVGNLGYDFLNSEKCTSLISELKSLELKVLTEHSTEDLLKRYKNENKIHDKRETEMLKNIINYCNNNPFDNAVLICGTDHKLGLINKINEYSIESNSQLNWSIYNHI